MKTFALDMNKTGSREQVAGRRSRRIFNSLNLWVMIWPRGVGGESAIIISIDHSSNVLKKSIYVQL